MNSPKNNSPFGPPPPPVEKPHGIKRIIAIISGKGGVGKSTISANIALAIKNRGYQTGLLDADLTGHSQSLLFDSAGSPERLQSQYAPFESLGVKIVSFGFLYPDAKSIIWRGPMISNGIKSLFTQTTWGEIDYLIIDLPPGTSDAQLTIIRDIPIDGGVIITTPDQPSSAVAERGLSMLLELKKPVIGIIENMGTAECPRCGHEFDIFGTGAGETLSKKYGVKLIGKIPLDHAMQKAAMARMPIIQLLPDSPAAKIFLKIGDEILSMLANKQAS